MIFVIISFLYISKFNFPDFVFLNIWLYWHPNTALAKIPRFQFLTQSVPLSLPPNMTLLGDDGRGYELARKLEACGVWRTWLGESSHANFLHYLNSPSTWEVFMRVDETKSRAQIQLQLRVRALLFDKASVSLFLRSNPSSSSSSLSLAVSKLNPTCEFLIV